MVGLEGGAVFIPGEENAHVLGPLQFSGCLDSESRL